MTVNWTLIENKWREIWCENSVDESTPDSREKKFITVAYPYPNSPQHIGHGRTYTIADISARFYRMRGYNVLFPMGFHYTGTPILGMASRIEDNDEKLIEALDTLYGVPKDVIKTFVDPVKIADYFHAEIKQGMIEMGYSIDWRREFTTIDPAYKKFISWQIESLRDQGYIEQGSHPVGWCPRDENPVSQHDTLGDVEPSFTEYLLADLRLDDNTMIPAATLRPETIYGVTNLWVNPDINYKIVMVDDSKWIVSKECAHKLSFLDHTVEIIGDISGKDLIGKSIRVSAINKTVPILPASFVNSTTGTGIVMSVPAHAPYDLQALLDLQGDKNSDVSELARNITPIRIIKTGEGENMVEQVLEKFNISSQADPAMESATKQVYNTEFNDGVMLGNTDTLVGMSVKQARDESYNLQNCGKFLEMTNAPVQCRCGTECVVKVLNNQWFLNYGDKDWKKIGKECFDSLDIKPKEMRQEFDHVLDWIQQRACARQHGLGTVLPWDKDWIVESLTDSVIYMSYYLIVRFVNSGDIDPERLNNAFFDYTLLGKGDPNTISSSIGVDVEKLHEIRSEFEYFYPMDARHSGRDLVPNHLLFFVLNHIAIFPKKYWPRSIVINGSVLMNGKKMSKSMGNIIPLRGAITKYGADPIRLAIIGSAELLQDADFDSESIQSIQNRLGSILEHCGTVDEKTHTLQQEDRWILARLHTLIVQVTDEIENMRLREALHNILFNFEKNLIWYKKRVALKKRTDTSGIFYDILSNRVQLLAPFAPFVAEEMWQKLKNTASVFTSSWPTSERFDSRDSYAEDLLRDIVADIEKILRVTKIKPKQIILYTASPLKYNVYKEVLSMTLKHILPKDIMKTLFNDLKFVDIKKDPDFVKKTTSEIFSKSPEQVYLENTINVDEKKMLQTQLESFEDEYNAKILVYCESDKGIHDPNDKARFARPHKPAIFVE